MIAQLIKLHDYISRYEWDVYRYPTQFIRVKKQNWNKVKRTWSYPDALAVNQLEEEEKSVPFQKIKRLFKSKASLDETENKIDDDKGSERIPNTEVELKQLFLDKIFQFQLKWATSTVNRISMVDEKYEWDPLLKYLLQRFPDTYLLMYAPVFRVKNVPMDGEILFISPLGIEILYFMETNEHSAIMAGNERTWSIETKYDTVKILNPTIALKRTEQIIKGILQAENIDFPIRKTILSRVNPIVYTVEPYQTKIIGKLEYPQWFKERRTIISTLKNNQLKAAEALLRHCLSVSAPRPEWEEDMPIQILGDLE